MILVDTSITVPAFASWHERHDAAVGVLSRGPRLPAQVAIETYSVLTRLPDPHRVEPSAVFAYLQSWFTDVWVTLSAKAFRNLLGELSDAGLGGGATYDGVVAATARHARATLVTADRRALPTYSVIGVDFEFVG